MHVISEIDDFLAFLQSPIRSHGNEFIAFGLEEFDKKPHIQAMNGIKTLFYRIAILLNDSVDLDINNRGFQASRPYTLCFFSPFHSVSARQKSNLKGQSIQFSESFVHSAYGSSRFHEEFPFFWSDNNVFYMSEEEAAPLIQLGERIVYEYNALSRFSDIVVRDYLHIFLILAKRIMGTREAVEDISMDYALFRRFFMLVNKSWPVIRTVEHAAKALAVTPAHLWLIVKRLSGQTPLEIINQRVLRDAQTMLLHSELNVSEIGFRLEFRERPHFTRFFKNLTGVSPVEYIRQSAFRNK
ncbi:MAG TPA: helix-turn-helix transcriptional regulator [Cyclobacteriaceae bacterium]|nr:helix-turn-helix transcriptional regulator [Cyclobacteriaceae bacterium]